jgi:hypothetical protein
VSLSAPQLRSQNRSAVGFGFGARSRSQSFIAQRREIQNEAHRLPRTHQVQSTSTGTSRNGEYSLTLPPTYPYRPLTEITFVSDGPDHTFLVSSAHGKYLMRTCSTQPPRPAHMLTRLTHMLCRQVASDPQWRDWRLDRHIPRTQGGSLVCQGGPFDSNTGSDCIWRLHGQVVVRDYGQGAVRDEAQACGEEHRLLPGMGYELYKLYEL